jgi:low temperature requirement protein LtrA
VTPEAPQPGRVSTLELFFDLVFVFTITQLTTVLIDGDDGRALLQVVLMLGLIFWMYGGYAWLTNSVGLDRLERRLLLLGGMAAFLVMALAIPHAFDGDGLAFGLAYLVIVSIHTGLYTRATSESSRQAILRLAPFNATTGMLVLVGGIAGGTATYVLWTLAFAAEWVTPLVAGTDDFEIEPAHFVERHGLLVIVAIGESVVAIGIGAGHLDVDVPLVAVAVLGLLVSACLWWTYFGSGEDEHAERALAEAHGRQGRLAINAFGYPHLGLLLGVIAAAAGLKYAIAHPYDPIKAAAAVELGAGVAVFMASDLWFRSVLGLGRGPWRLVAVALALATIPIGTELSATAQLGVLVASLTLCLTMDSSWGDRGRLTARGAH